MSAKTLAICAAVVAVAVLGLFLLFGHEKDKTAGAELRGRVSEEKAAGAELQADVSAGVARATDRAVLRGRIIEKEVSRETQRIRLALDGGDGRIEPAVSVWADGFDRLRASTGSADLEADESVNSDPGVRILPVLDQRSPGAPPAGNA